jgi:hypothetical protein
MNSLAQQFHDLGQSLQLDNISRNLMLRLAANSDSSAKADRT